jgi:hypothetical protein
MTLPFATITACLTHSADEQCVGNTVGQAARNCLFMFATFKLHSEMMPSSLCYNNHCQLVGEDGLRAMHNADRRLAMGWLMRHI